MDPPDPVHCYFASGSAFSEILIKMIKSYHEKISNIEADAFFVFFLCVKIVFIVCTCQHRLDRIFFLLIEPLDGRNAELAGGFLSGPRRKVPGKGYSNPVPQLDWLAKRNLYKISR
jgi:hypothetical protein